ncbi:hypothetical protein CXF68_03895 [Tenacibaculum sp. Bg11-29]|uniref:DUF6624 domain-containing protein n=1 Tax=Tenacibaculum sp. Bg11-29 TaxID=2058306 RepID=UPI000C33B97D|nr:DUF6624 domain-containing protein [Tenacibaculum sp. Bg11-29]PKH49895.1 hypothetical protein CXF68_03895 [Tenacibaculum sp. Bg11-29]
MNKIVRILLTVTILVSCKSKYKKNEAMALENIETNKEISILIDSLYKVDQRIQLQMMDASKNGEREKVKKLELEETEIFKRHIPILKKIYNKVGYPTIVVVGEEISNKFFMLVQHSDFDVNFQEKMLKKIFEEVKKGNVSIKNFAYLTDRVQLAQEKSQIYGTQVKFNTELGQIFPKNLIDSLNVNIRRKEVGLEPIEEYLNLLLKMHFQVNKAHYDKIGIKEPKLYEME